MAEYPLVLLLTTSYPDCAIYRAANLLHKSISNLFSLATKVNERNGNVKIFF